MNRVIKSVAIVGMGALGMMYGEAIAKVYGFDFVHFVMNEERYVKHKNDIYKVNGKVLPFVLQSAANAKPVDLVIVATKFGGLDAALTEMQNLVGENTIIVSVLNGITSEEKIIERFGEEHVLHSVVLGMDAVREGTELTYTHRGFFRIGVVDEGLRPALQALATFLDSCHLKYVIEDDIMHALWAKLLLNVGINQTCMVYATNYGGALANEQVRLQMFAAMHEVLIVAQKEGVHLGEADFEACVKVLEGLAPEGLPSMRQDALAKRYSEVELFAGTILRLAAKHGVEVPVNKYYYEKIKEIEATY